MLRQHDLTMPEPIARSLALILVITTSACGGSGGETTSTKGTGSAASSTGVATTSGGSGDSGTSTPTSSGEATGTSAGATSGSTGDAVGPGCAAHVRFKDLQARIFSGCGGYVTCHVDGLGGGLDLAEGSAYTNLVGVASAIAPGELLVDPGDSAGSLLYRKLIDDLAADDSEGGPMPKTMTAQMWAKLPDEQIEQVRCWIDEGAPND